MTTIFWFSGTGNSLYAAKQLAAGLENSVLYPMKSGVPQKAVGGTGEKIGFVFPSYYGNLPRYVRHFAEKIEIASGTYVFAVVTMGGLGQGSVAELEKILIGKNLRLDYGRGILMNGNYVINYNPADSEKFKSKLLKISEKLRGISLEISAGKRIVKKIRITAANLYKNTEQLDAAFHAENSCAKCGQCARICPVQNIKLEKKPVWQHHCEHCVACISWCPIGAIQYGESTKTRRRYRNPEIMANELF